MNKYLIVKRTVDVILSAFALVLLLPILLLVAVLIKLDSKGPILYKQLRPGKLQKTFYVYKFRTMIQGADKSQYKDVIVTNEDNRITVLGKFLRRYKVDEVVQLINILKGDMSIVGPRPTLPDYLEDYEEWEMQRFDVQPGLTGLAQVNGNIYLTRLEKSEYDLEYVRKMSFWLDIKIVCKTIGIVLLGEEKFVKKMSGGNGT